MLFWMNYSIIWKDIATMKRSKLLVVHSFHCQKTMLILNEPLFDLWWNLIWPIFIVLRRKQKRPSDSCSPLYLFEIQKLRKLFRFPVKYVQNRKAFFGYLFGYQINFFELHGSPKIPFQFSKIAIRFSKILSRCQISIFENLTVSACSETEKVFSKTLAEIGNLFGNY